MNVQTTHLNDIFLEKTHVEALRQHYGTLLACSERIAPVTPTTAIWLKESNNKITF